LHVLQKEGQETHEEPFLNVPLVQTEQVMLVVEVPEHVWQLLIVLAHVTHVDEVVFKNN